ncbi:MAG: matrixin family metalloprotease [Deltaproteobacteria bacterium]|nr:matrixin family metalloprotease [Deltaproteobacteria bacterium]
MARSFGTVLKFSLYAAMLCLGTSSESFSYPTPVDFGGRLLRWDINIDAPTVTLGIDAENPDDATYYESMVKEAAALWSEVPGSYFKFKFVALEESPQVTIYLRSSLSGVRDTAGFTMFDDYDGETPKHCSIYVLVDTATADYWMGKVFLHELGHAAGLGHSLVPEAIMSYSLDTNSFALDIDDFAAIAHSYPANGDKPRLPLGCAVRPGYDSGDSDPTIALIFVVPLIFSLWPTSGRWRPWRAA